MKLFRNMDLYKFVILLSLVLTPAAVGYYFKLQGDIEAGKKALKDAYKTKGHLEQIATFQKEIEGLKASERINKTADPKNYRSYFLKQVTDTGYGIGSTDFQDQASDMPVSGNRTASDKVVSLTFKRDNKDLPVTREFVNAFVFNIEGQAPIWKLRSLKIANATIAEQRGRGAPPAETDDLWLIKEMKFSARQKRDATKRR